MLANLRGVVHEGISLFFILRAFSAGCTALTGVADFPRLCYFLARDGFLPRQLSLLGDRLVPSPHRQLFQQPLDTPITS